MAMKVRMAAQMGKRQGTVKRASSPSLVSLWKKYTARIIWYAMSMSVLGEALECRYFYEADDGVLPDEADHGREEHGDKQSGCYGQEEALYSEKHIDVDFMGLQAQK